MVASLSLTEMSSDLRVEAAAYGCVIVRDKINSSKSGKYFGIISEGNRWAVLKLSCRKSAEFCRTFAPITLLNCRYLPT